MQFHLWNQQLDLWSAALHCPIGATISRWPSNTLWNVGRFADTSVLVFPVCVQSAPCFFFHFHTPFLCFYFLLSREWVVKGVLALIFYSRLACLSPKWERSPLAQVRVNGRSGSSAECMKSVWFPQGVGGHDWCESRKAFTIPVRLNGKGDDSQRFWIVCLELQVDCEQIKWHFQKFLVFFFPFGCNVQFFFPNEWITYFLSIGLSQWWWSYCEL